jgi:hypothetical protein
MRWMHGSCRCRIALVDHPYGAEIVLDYDGFIAGRALIRTQKLMPVNLSETGNRGSLLNHVHVTGAWVKGAIYCAPHQENKMPGQKAGHHA